MDRKGTIENGRLVLDDGSQLPDGTRVRVKVGDGQDGSARRRPTNVEEPLTRIGRHAVRTGKPDLADEHDHHVYGVPKRKKVATRKRTTPRAAARRRRGS